MLKFIVGVFTSWIPRLRVDSLWGQERRFNTAKIDRPRRVKRRKVKACNEEGWSWYREVIVWCQIRRYISYLQLADNLLAKFITIISHLSENSLLQLPSKYQRGFSSTRRLFPLYVQEKYREREIMLHLEFWAMWPSIRPATYISITLVS